MCQTAKALSEQGYEYMNIEQDLGIAGLRKAKKFFGPVAMLRKYTVEQITADATETL